MQTRSTRRQKFPALLMALAILTAADAVRADPQTKGQQKCVNAMNKDGAKVAATQGKENTYCVKNAGKGKEPDPDGCLTRDAKGKVAKAAAKVETDFGKTCFEEAPDFGLPGVSSGTAAAVVDAAIDEEIQLVADVFGTPLSDAIATDKEGAKCQTAVSKDYEKTAATYMKGFLKCKKSALKAGAAGAADLEACVLDDPRGKAASTVSKLAADIGKKCTANLFPGLCSGEELDGLANCIHERVRCIVCRTQNAMDGLDVDCDADDDGASNGSCVLPPNVAVRRRIENLAPAANIGHRGTGNTRPGNALPENSLAAFLAAMTQGADGIELDVELTADGQLVVMHDDTLDRTTTCSGCVNAYTLAAVQECLLLDGNGSATTERPPTLSEVYEVLPPGALVNVELKVFEPPCLTPGTGPVELAEAAVAEIERLGVASRTFFSSFDLDALAALKEQDATLYAGYLILIVDAGTIASATELGLDAIHPFLIVSAENVSAMRAAGLQVNVWTVDGAAAMRANLDKGVSGIITDEPAVLEAVIAERGTAP